MWKILDISNDESEKIVLEAKKVSEFRHKCKYFLEKNNLIYDKFTVVEHDSEIGYIAEQQLLKYLIKEFKNINVKHWTENFDLEEIKNILQKSDPQEDEINLIKTFFYDKYDILLSSKMKKIYIDVKTAKTQKTPSSNWNFLYPTVQTNKKEDDCVVLTYLIYNNDHLYQMYIVGVINYNEILNSEIQKKGTFTKFHTCSRTDNYITYLRDYKDLTEYINIYFNLDSKN